jgi:integrase
MLEQPIEFPRKPELIGIPSKSDEQLLEQFLRSLNSRETFRKRNEQLGAFWGFLRDTHACGLADVTCDMLRDWRDEELCELAPASRNAYLGAVRVFYRWLREQHGAEAAWADLGSVKNEPVPDDLAARILTPEQVEAILAQLPAAWYPFFRLQYACAARLGEIVALRWDWIVPNLNGASVTLYGKFGKTRWVQINEQVLTMLRRLPVRGPRVFMTDVSTASAAFKAAARAAGCPQASTHWLRHSRASHLAASRDISVVELRDMLGHKSIETTSRYLHVSGAAKLMPETLPESQDE